MLAGNVVVAVAGGSLTITGDALANEIRVDQSGLAADEFRVRAAGALDTTINGLAGPVVFSGVLKNIRISLGEGNDMLLLHDAVVPGGISIDGGNGDNFIQLGEAVDTGDPWVTVGKNLSIRNGDGFDFMTIHGLDVQEVSLDNRSGGSQVQFDLFPTQIRKGVTIRNRDGFDQTELSDWAHVYGDVTIKNGNGDSGLRLYSAWIWGDLSVTNGTGRDEFEMVDGAVLRAASIRNGSGGSSMTLTDGADPGPDFDSLAVRNADGQDDFTLGVLVVTGALVVNNGSGGSSFDVHSGEVGGVFSIMSLAGVDSIDLHNLQLHENAAIGTGDGADVIHIDDSVFDGAFALNTGGGADIVGIEISGMANGPMSNFLGLFTLNTGAGNDTVAAGIGAQVGNRAFFMVASTWDGGDDPLDTASIGTSLFSVPPVILNFETVS